MRAQFLLCLANRNVNEALFTTLEFAIKRGVNPRFVLKGI